MRTSLRSRRGIPYRRTGRPATDDPNLSVCGECEVPESFPDKPQLRLVRLDAEKSQQAEDDGALKGMLAIRRDSSSCALPLPPPPGTWNVSLRQRMTPCITATAIADGSGTIDSAEFIAIQTGETWEGAGGNRDFNGPAVAKYSDAALLSFCDGMGTKVRVTNNIHGGIK